MFKFFVIICFCSFALAEESSECDCDILQIHSEDDPNKYYNFTKQWDEEEEEYFYFSIEHHLKQWRHELNKYINFKDTDRNHLRNPISCQNGSQKLILESPWQENESKVFEAQCLKDNKCLASEEDVKGEISIHYFSYSCLSITYFL